MMFSVDSDPAEFAGPELLREVISDEG